MGAASAIRCPSCASRMEVRREGVAGVDVCAECGGLWLDAGELEQITGVSSSSSPGATQYRKCPHCKMAMARVVIEGISVERCTTCKGLFLDAGELEQIRNGSAKRGPQKRPADFSSSAVREFDCMKCGRHFPREKGYAVPGGHLCDACAGHADQNDAGPGPLERILGAFVDLLPGRGPRWVP